MSMPSERKKSLWTYAMCTIMQEKRLKNKAFIFMSWLLHQLIWEITTLYLLIILNDYLLLILLATIMDLISIIYHLSFWINLQFFSIPITWESFLNAVISPRESESLFLVQMQFSKSMTQRKINDLKKILNFKKLFHWLSYFSSLPCGRSLQAYAPERISFAQTPHLLGCPTSLWHSHCFQVLTYISFIALILLPVHSFTCFSQPLDHELQRAGHLP